MKKLSTLIFVTALSTTFVATEAQAAGNDTDEEQGIIAYGRSLAFQLRQNHLAQLHIIKATIEELLEGWRTQVGSADGEADAASIESTEATTTPAIDLLDASSERERVPSEAIERLRQSVRDASGQLVLPARRGASSVDRPQASSTESPLRVERLTRVEQLDATEIADSLIAERAERIREAVRSGSIQRVQAAAHDAGLTGDVLNRCAQQASSSRFIELPRDRRQQLRSAVGTACRALAESSASGQAGQDK